jgi:hypothetical protein
MERHDVDDIIHVDQEENEGDQGLRFTISDGARLTELATCDVELMEDESKRLAEKQERHE